MKIGVLTQPLHNNYGGLLQAYALQSFLKNQGHEALTIDIPSRPPRLWGIRGIILNILRKYLLRQNIKSVFPISLAEKNRVGQHTSRFVNEHIRTTEKIATIEKISKLKSYKFDAYVVGSDQVWRPAYSPGMSAYFLGFLGDDDKTRRVAYAASFGVDHCNEFSAEDLKLYSALAKKFHAIGVREDSAVELCYKHFDVRAEHVIDPTLLLEKEAYCELVRQDSIPPCAGNMMVYVLDRSSEKQEMIENVAQVLGLTPYTVMPDEADGVYPPVTQWLRGFMDAEYVVTDSFHGVAFSIIFNKPFIAIGNHDRGLARFTSILKKFGLDNRLVFSSKDLTLDKINENIDFSKINKIKKSEQELASHFLCQALLGKC